MDETCLSQGELYTIITNKSAHGGKGSLVAMIRGTRSEDIIYYLNHLPRTKRLKVKEITIDLSPSMRLIAKRAFPNATIVSDRFHVQKLMNEAISDLRVDYRWQAIDQENEEVAFAKEIGRKFIPHTFENGDTRRQLLARSRHIVMKHHSKWTDSQKRRAAILFREYPAIEEAYGVSMKLTDIFNTKCNKSVALTKLARWYEEVEKLNCKFFNSVTQTMQNNYATIVNYFENRSTNASAESFNAKVKAFRNQFRGVADIPFFIFRLATIFA
jgi:transposase